MVESDSYFSVNCCNHSLIFPVILVVFFKSNLLDLAGVTAIGEF